MTKNELMEIARECGFRSNSFSKACTKHSSGAWVDVEDELLAFANTILERAAVECDNRQEFYEAAAIECEESGGEALWARASGASQCGMKIRALKITQ